MTINYTLMAVAIASLVTSACGEVKYDHIALGFSDKAEMEAAFAKGYHTKQKFIEIQATSYVTATPTQQTSTSSAELHPPSASPNENTPVLSVSIADNSQFTPSFDCIKASNSAERLICSNNELSKLDLELSILYKAAYQSFEGEVKKDIKAQQVEWVNVKRNACSDVSCLTAAYQERIAFFNNAN
jgi:uncharacterized protein YecT (DUF1311 family)